MTTQPPTTTPTPPASPEPHWTEVDDRTPFEAFADLLDLYEGYVRYTARNGGDTTQQSIGRRMLIEMFERAATAPPPTPGPVGITDEAVEAGVTAYWDWDTESEINDLVRGILEAALPHLAVVPPAPRPPGESLDDVLEDIEAMDEWLGVELTKHYDPEDDEGRAHWAATPTADDDECHRHGPVAYGPTRLAAAIALRDAIREAAAATSAEAAPETA